MSFLSRLSKVKVKDVGAFLKSEISVQNLKPKAEAWAVRYKKEEIDKGTFTPLRDTLVGVFCLAYAVSWPTEYRHLMHERAHGGH
eukprot:CAMPEP_0170133288 /NCGR_PEP_ID=MMETSP0033_2-20121228/1197_1 /TAXON_ID=195969 /ORGANISM="Dolichomastix tenuilepis, Strain CCMP3274" /LENGTH=84 /DNA_ID=CAMNT_0010368759 /DNA_START=6 /DNA_END=260 /DNA_ORIENTATION=+